MSLVVVGIDAKRREKFASTPEIEAKMSSLDEYLLAARKVIGTFTYGVTRKRMLASEEAVAFVAEHLMLATIRHDESKGRTYRSYLNDCGHKAICRWIHKSKQARKNGLSSLDKSWGEDDFCLHDVTPDEKQTETEKIISSEYVESLLNHRKLNTIQQQVLRLKFVENMTYREIAKIIGKAPQRAEQIVVKAISILKNEVSKVQER